MRPDKKKGRQNNNRKELAHKQQQQQQQHPPRREVQSQAERSQAVAGDGEAIGAKFKKREIENNWTKYELPSSDENSDNETSGMTGEDFNYVLQRASKQLHFILIRHQLKDVLQAALMPC